MSDACQIRGNLTGSAKGNPEARLAWLAGIVDGEGTICAWKAHNRTPRARIAVYNSNWNILKRAQQIINEITGRKYKIQYINRKRERDRLPYGAIQIQSRKDIDLVLLTLIPFLVGKKLQARAAIRLNEYRTTKLADELKKLNKNPPGPHDQAVQTRRQGAEAQERVEALGIT